MAISGDTLNFEIVTPTGRAFGGAVMEVTAPTLDGEIGVLPGHVPLLAAVRTGIVTAKMGADDDVKFAVAHGVFEIAHDKALLMAERFAKKEDVDIVTTRARFKEIDEELTAWQGEQDDPRRIELVEEEQWLGALLELIGDPPPPIAREITRFQLDPVAPLATDETAADAAQESKEA
jgi:F-type H+-transporting ATPase subunit epsilon